MTQHRLDSFMEAVCNAAVGYGVALATQLAIFPLFGIRIPVRDNLAIANQQFDPAKQDVAPSSKSA